MGIKTLGRVEEPAHTHTSDIGVCCMCSWARCTHTWVNMCLQAQYSYLQGRVSTFIYWSYRHMHSCRGHFTCIWELLTHRTICARAPKGSQAHSHLFRSVREPLLMGSLQSL